MTSSRGPRGYPDYQRVENWDGDTILPQEEHTLSPGLNFTSKALEVSRYATLALILEVIAGGFEVKVEWYQDAALTIFLGERKVFVEASSGKHGVLRFTNLGPFAQIELVSAEALSKIKISAETTNRTAVQEATPPEHLLLSNTQKYKANEGKGFPIPWLATGVGRIFLNQGSSHLAQAIAYVFSSKGHFQPIASVTGEAGKEYFQVEYQMPLMPVTIDVFNGAEEQEIQVVATVTP